MTVPFLNSEDYDERAHQCYESGDYEQALLILREGICRYPDAADLHVGLGYVRLAREEYAWARQAFEAALALEADHEDACVGLGESLLKFGETAEALLCFSRVDELEPDNALDLGLAIGRALYREGFFRESRARLLSLSAQHPKSAEVHAALGYTLHALGDEAGAIRQLRRALRLDGGFHEARIYLSHVLYERGDHSAALRELDRVPPSEHWDSLSLWRAIDLKVSLNGITADDSTLDPWRARLSELDVEPDAIDHLLAEVETAFGEDEECSAMKGGVPSDSQSTPVGGLLEGTHRVLAGTHRVRTREGEVFVGTWEQIVFCLRDRTADRAEPISVFMHRAAERIRRLTGQELPHQDAESFVRGSADLGLLWIEF
jgi:tetratricopeptide (TPR) repeat protein